MLRLRVVNTEHADRQTTWKSPVLARRWVRSIQTHVSRDHRLLATCPVREKKVTRQFFSSIVQTLAANCPLTAVTEAWEQGRVCQCCPLPCSRAHVWCQQLCVPDSGLCNPCLFAQCFQELGVWKSGTAKQEDCGAGSSHVKQNHQINIRKCGL